jgi:hypothetical protein
MPILWSQNTLRYSNLSHQFPGQKKTRSSCMCHATKWAKPLKNRSACLPNIHCHVGGLACADWPAWQGPDDQCLERLGTCQAQGTLKGSWVSHGIISGVAGQDFAPVVGTFTGGGFGWCHKYRLPPINKPAASAKPRIPIPIRGLFPPRQRDNWPSCAAKACSLYRPARKIPKKLVPRYLEFKRFSSILSVFFAVKYHDPRGLTASFCSLLARFSRFVSWAPASGRSLFPSVPRRPGVGSKNATTPRAKCAAQRRAGRRFGELANLSVLAKRFE